MTPAVKALIIANVVAFLAALAVPEMTLRLGLQPEAVFGGALWQPLTYMFLHGGVSHILFNMLSLWMFGVELERMWGTAFFTRFYFVCGVGAAATTLLLSLLPGQLGQSLYYSLTVGASGAIYGLLMAYALYFPTPDHLLHRLPDAREGVRRSSRAAFRSCRRSAALVTASRTPRTSADLPSAIST